MLDARALHIQRLRLDAIDTLISVELGIDPTLEGLQQLSWDSDRARSFAAAVSKLPSLDTADYAPGQVVPRMYVSYAENPQYEDYPIPSAVDTDAVRRALLFAHGVELDDMLVPEASKAARTNDPGFFIRALRTFLSLRPLAERGIVSYVVLPVSWYQNYALGLVRDRADNREFREALARIAGHVAPVAAIEHLRAAAAETRHDFEDWFMLAIAGTALPDYIQDLEVVKVLQEYSNASVWLPSRGHLELLGVLSIAGRLPVGLTDAAIAARLVEVNLPGYEIDISAVVDLRRTSDALERWRTALSDAVVALDRLPAGADDEAPRVEIQRALAAFAERIAAEASREFPRYWALRRAATTVGFGVLGGMAGAGVSGSLVAGAVSAAASGGARAALDAVQDVSRSSNRRAALGAARDHALIVSGAARNR
jgi:hypothetical protein